MKRRILTFAVLAAALLTACNKPQPNMTENSGAAPLVFTATMEGKPGTKVTLESDGLTPSWEIGDSLLINKTFKYKAQNAGTTATFWSAGASVGESFTYEAIFPTSYIIGLGWGEYTEWAMWFPPDEEYEWVDGNFNMPMYAKSNDTNLQFKNLCGVLRITVTAKQMQQVKRIRVGNYSKPMFGRFKVNANGAMELTNVNPNPTTEERRRSIIYTEPVSVYEESKVFYFPIVPTTYQSLSISLSEDGENFPFVCLTKYEQDIVIERNKIYNVTFKEDGETEYITITPGDLNDEDFEK